MRDSGRSMKLVCLAAFVLFLLAGCASTGGTATTSATRNISCTDGPDLNATKANGRPVNDEIELTADYERQLISAGIAAHQTRFWNGCLQTFVRVDGKEVMKFYDPGTLKEVGT
jgi:hypothetical protein